MHASTFLLFVALVILGGATSCDKISGEGPLTTETRDTDPFTGVSSEISGSVDVYPGSGPTVEVSAQRNIQEILKTRVTRGVLHLYFSRSVRLASSKPIRIVIHVPSLSSVALQGSGSLRVHGPVTTAIVALSVSGSGTLQTDSVTATEKLRIKVSGSGSVRPAYLSAARGDLTVEGSGMIGTDAGQVKSLHIVLSGSGDLGLGAVKVLDAEVHGSGSGDTWLGTTDTLTAYLSGSGNIYYRGTPKLTAHVSGSGKIKPW